MRVNGQNIFFVLTVVSPVRSTAISSTVVLEPYRCCTTAVVGIRSISISLPDTNTIKYPPYKVFSPTPRMHRLPDRVVPSRNKKCVSCCWYIPPLFACVIMLLKTKYPRHLYLFADICATYTSRLHCCISHQLIATVQFVVTGHIIICYD